MAKAKMANTTTTQTQATRTTRNTNSEYLKNILKNARTTSNRNKNKNKNKNKNAHQTPKQKQKPRGYDNGHFLFQNTRHIPIPKSQSTVHSAQCASSSSSESPSVAAVRYRSGFMIMTRRTPEHPDTNTRSLLRAHCVYLNESCIVRSVFSFEPRINSSSLSSCSSLISLLVRKSCLSNCISTSPCCRTRMMNFYFWDSLK